MKMKVKLGVDLLKENPRKFLPSKKTKVGLLCHPSSTTQKSEHVAHLLENQVNLTKFFGPQHGIYGETQDNMIEWEDHFDAQGRPIYSLYGKRRIPSEESLQGIDLLVIDLFDVGARYYTFIYTMAYMLEACGKLGIPVLVCDRPNPLGGAHIEGPILSLQFKSFVGLFEIPVCHGMTVAELAKFFCSQFSKPPQLKIIPLKGWNRNSIWADTGLRWTLPSPNMPQFETSVLYPGMCLLEATSLSEGRGTTRPFELIGAPFLDWNEVEREYSKLSKKYLRSRVIFHQQGFIPTFHKFQGQICKGALQICEQPRNFQALRHAVVLLWIFRRLYGSEWTWKDPPYEYEFEKWPIDILMGGSSTREVIDQGLPLGDLFKSWEKDEQKFKRQRLPYLLYK